MALLWRSGGPVTARRICGQLYPDTTKAQHGTAQRLLQQLEDKGCLERDRSLPVEATEYPCSPRGNRANSPHYCCLRRPFRPVSPPSSVGGSLPGGLTARRTTANPAPREDHTCGFVRKTPVS
ncbi:MAG: hypothetical protein JSU70_20265 [Phycisphaerales bacterium]|nr:MAG: hypothetical protein JSU70_20265 [Phycisphaerales bacterium]